MKRWKSAALTGLTLLALSGQAWADDTLPSKTETRHMSGFKDLELDCSADVSFTVAPTTSVTITAPANLIPLLLTKIEGDKLVIKRKEKIEFSVQQLLASNPIKLAITGPSLRSINLQGSGSVHAPGLTGDAIQLTVAGSGEIEASGAIAPSVVLNLPGSGEIKLTGIQSKTASISIEGSGAVEAAGQVDHLDSSIAGSGKIKAADLKAQSLAVHVSGSGTLSAYAAQSAVVAVTGSGDVAIAGNPPQRQVQRSGSGDVKFQ